MWTQTTRQPDALLRSRPCVNCVAYHLYGLNSIHETCQQAEDIQVLNEVFKYVLTELRGCWGSGVCGLGWDKYSKQTVVYW